MSIRNEEQLVLAHEQLLSLYEALASLKEEMADRNPFGFRVMAEGPLDEIRRIRGEIAQFTGESLLEAEEVDIRLRITGPLVRWRDTPVSVLASFLKSFRNAVRSILGEVSLPDFPNVRGLSLDVASDFAIVDLIPGSLDVGLRMPSLDRYQTDLFAKSRVAPMQAAMNYFLATAEWIASSAAPDALTETIPDPHKRRVVLKAVQPLIPKDEQVVDTLELYGPLVPTGTRIRITKRARNKVSTALRSSISAEQVEYSGEIREIDLDSMTFWLRNILGEQAAVKCSYSRDLEKDALDSLGKRVVIVAVRPVEVGGTARGIARVQDIQSTSD